MKLKGIFIHTHQKGITYIERVAVISIQIVMRRWPSMNTFINKFSFDTTTLHLIIFVENLSTREWRKGTQYGYTESGLVFPLVTACLFKKKNGLKTPPNYSDLQSGRPDLNPRFVYLVFNQPVKPQSSLWGALGTVYRTRRHYSACETLYHWNSHPMARPTKS